MSQSDDGGESEADVVESEPDVDKHQDQGDDDGLDGLDLHLFTDGRADAHGLFGLRSVVGEGLGQGFRSLFGSAEGAADDDLGAHAFRSGVSFLDVAVAEAFASEDVSDFVNFDLLGEVKDDHVAAR